MNPRDKKRDTNGECDLINFKDDCSIASKHSKEIDKNKQIADYQIKMLEEFLNTTGNKTQTKSALTSEQNIQFQKFFDEYESKQKTNGNIQNKGIAKSAENIIIIGNPTIIIPKVVPKDDNDFKVSENFISELISKTNTMSQHETTKGQTTLKQEGVSTKRANHLSSETKRELDNCRSIMTEILAKNDIPYAALSLCKNAFDIPLANEKAPNKSEENYLKTTYNDKIKPNNAYINDLVNKHDIRYLEAIKKDDKKRCELLTENEKANMTPGPTLYEKSMVLPPIMQRLSERKEALEKSKLVPNAVDINKDKTDYTTDTAGPSKSANINFANPVPGFSNYKLSDLKKTNGIIDPSSTKKKSQHDCTKLDRKDIDYPTVESLRVLRKDLKDLAELQVLSPTSDIENLRVLNPPEVLMENCNKQRFIAHAAGRLFEEFIKSG